MLPAGSENMEAVPGRPSTVIDDKLPGKPAADLPFTIELIDGEKRRVLARAASRSLAEIILAEAQAQFPGQRLVLKQETNSSDGSRR